jgi:hypothetical protein
VLVVATDGRLLVAAIADRKVMIPTTRAVCEVASVSHDGERREVPWTDIEGGVRLEVADCARSVSYYEVTLGDL